MRGRPLLITWASISAYLIAGFLTFGHAWNAGEAECRQREYCFSAQFSAGPPALLSGLIWPVYWFGLGAVVVTKS